MYKPTVGKQRIQKMSTDLLSGFWCEVQRNGQSTRYERLRWTPDEFQFESGGVTLHPGNHTISLFSGGERVFTLTSRIRRTPKTLVALFAGGLNPRHRNGTWGTRVYAGSITEYAERVDGLHANRV
jgi:hypothetical protein